jgi:hypothetical protein
LESRIDKATGEGARPPWPQDRLVAGLDLARRRRVPVVGDDESGVLKGGADPRRPSYALGL